MKVKKMRRYKLELKEFSEINITPLTDVMLVLLIIFMVASPILVSGVLKVKLPTSSSSETGIKNNVTIFLTEKNQIFINDNLISEKDLQSVLKNEFLRTGNTDVILNADVNVIYGEVVRVLDLVKGAGATKLMFGTQNTGL
jgi:biopolymer transport protein TolR